MLLMKRIILSACMCIPLLHAQNNKQNVEVTFTTLMYGKPYKLNEGVVTTGNELIITKTRFFVSQIELLANNQSIWKEDNSYHLMDIEGKQQAIQLNVPNTHPYDQIQFNLGIDSATNVAGVLGGDLDPTNGMYWTWQSGYINAKIEGVCKSCATRNNVFEYHLGGYRYPYESLQTITLDVKSQSLIQIGIELSHFFSAVDLSNDCQIMSPGIRAKQLSADFARCFQIIANE